MPAGPDPEPLPIVTIFFARDAQTIGRFGLVAAGFTILYHASILGQTLPQASFTNNYHRDEGLTTDSDL